MPASLIPAATQVGVGMLTNAITGDGGAGAMNAQAQQNMQKSGQIADKMQANATETWDSYKKNFQPFEGKLAGLIDAATAPGAVDAAAGAAGATVAQNFKGAKDATGRDLSRNGVAVNSGNATVLAQDAALEEAKAKAGAQTVARQSATDRGLQLTKMGVDVGRSFADDASVGLGNAGSILTGNAATLSKMSGDASTSNRQVAAALQPAVNTAVEGGLSLLKDKVFNTTTGAK